jgi:hypothetical protein
MGTLGGAEDMAMRFPTDSIAVATSWSVLRRDGERRGHAPLRVMDEGMVAGRPIPEQPESVSD